MDEDELMMLALDAGAEDFQVYDEVYEITTAPNDFSQVREKLEESGLEFLEASVQMVPTTTVKLDEKATEKMERLIERLEELDDVSNIYHNWERIIKKEKGKKHMKEKDLNSIPSKGTKVVRNIHNCSNNFNYHSQQEYLHIYIF